MAAPQSERPPQLFGARSQQQQVDLRADLRDRRARLAHQATRELQEARDRG